MHKRNRINLQQRGYAEVKWEGRKGTKRYTKVVKDTQKGKVSEITKCN